MDYGISQVTKRLFISGQFESSADVKPLQDLGITAIVNCREVQDPDYALSAFEVCWPQPGKPDDGTPRGLDWFAQGAEFFVPRAMNFDGATLVHCHAGMERSHAMLVLFLCLLGLSMDDAKRLAVEHRPLDILGYRYLNEVQQYLETRG